MQKYMKMYNGIIHLYIVLHYNYAKRGNIKYCCAVRDNTKMCYAERGKIKM